MNYFPKECRLLMFLLYSINTQGQTSLKKFHSAGGIIGYGQQVNTTTRYNPLFIIGDFSWQFGSKSKNNFIAYFFEPQFNLVATKGPMDIELAANIGVRFYQKISNKIFLYQMVGSGPQLITADFSRQAKGFLFSNIIGIGIYKKMAERKFCLSFKCQFRHLSNAGFKKPNRGINTLNIFLGLTKIR